jgi:hypothetical protein
MCECGVEEKDSDVSRLQPEEHRTIIWVSENVAYRLHGELDVLRWPWTR